MSKVKFIQWGTTGSPKNYSDRWKAENVMSDEFAELLKIYAGGIIFVTYYDAEYKIVQELWANGVMYSIGGGGTAAGAACDKIIYGDDPVDADGQNGITPSNPTEEGYIYVYKASSDHDAKQTAYYWDVTNSKWLPFNVDAENVYFPNGFCRTEAWGKKGKLADGIPVNDVHPDKIGRTLNLVEVMEHYLISDIQPSVTVTCSGGTSTLATAYKNDNPLTFTGRPAATGESYAHENYYLYNSPLYLCADYESEIKLASNAHEKVTFGPLTVQGMSYGCKYTNAGGEEIDAPGTSTMSGDSVAVVSQAESSYTHGDKMVTIKKDGSEIDSASSTAILARNSISLTTSKRSIEIGDNTYTASGETKTKWNRKLYKDGDATQSSITEIAVPKLNVTGIKAWNNTRSTAVSIPTDNTENPYTDKTYDLSSWNLSSGVDSVEKTFTVYGYLPVYIGEIVYAPNKKPNEIKESDLAGITGCKRIGADGFDKTNKTYSYVTKFASSQRMIVFAIPSGHEYTIVSGNKPLRDDELEVDTFNFIKDGSNKDVQYTVILVKTKNIDTAYAKNHTLKITF